MCNLSVSHCHPIILYCGHKTVMDIQYNEYTDGQDGGVVILLVFKICSATGDVQRPTLEMRRVTIPREYGC